MRGALQDHRIERDADRRRARAHAHLHRMRRQRGGGRPAGRVPAPSSRRRLWIAAAAALAGWLFAEPLVFAFASEEPQTLERIAVRGTERLTAAEVARATGVQTGSPLADLDPAAVQASLEQHDWIAEAATLRLPDGALVVGVVERRPVATLRQGDMLYAVDERGAPFAPLEAPEPGLVQLVAGAAATPGEPSADLAEAVRIANRMPELGLARPAQVSVAAEGDPEGYAFQLAAPPARVVLGRAELDSRLDDLAHLVATRPDVVADATDIDLRFANQVVLRSAPAQEGSATKATGRGNAPPHNRPPAG